MNQPFANCRRRTSDLAYQGVLWPPGTAAPAKKPCSALDVEDLCAAACRTDRCAYANEWLPNKYLAHPKKILQDSGQVELFGLTVLANATAGMLHANGRSVVDHFAAGGGAGSGCPGSAILSLACAAQTV